MWGGLDFSKVTQLGNQLNDALQRAKTEFDKLDGPLGYEGEEEPRSAGISDPGLGGEFSVGTGLLENTGRQGKQATPQQEPHALEDFSKLAAVPAAKSNATENSSNGKPSSLQQPGIMHNDAHTAAISAAENVHNAAGRQSPSGKLVKKKIVRKIVRKVPVPTQPATADDLTAAGSEAASTSATAAAGKQPSQQPGSAVSTSVNAGGIAGAPARPNQAEPTVFSADATAADTRHSTEEVQAQQVNAAATSGPAANSIAAAVAPRPASGKKELSKKGLLGAVKIQQQQQQQQQWQSSHELLGQQQQQVLDEQQPVQVLAVPPNSTQPTVLHDQQQHIAADEPQHERSEAQLAAPEVVTSTDVAEHQARVGAPADQVQHQEQHQQTALPSLQEHHHQQKQQQDAVALEQQQCHSQQETPLEQPALKPEPLEGVADQVVCKQTMQQQQGAEAQQQQEAEMLQELLTPEQQYADVEQLLNELIEVCIQHSAAAAVAVEHGHQEQPALENMQQVKGQRALEVQLAAGNANEAAVAALHTAGVVQASGVSAVVHAAEGTGGDADSVVKSEERLQESHEQQQQQQGWEEGLLKQQEQTVLPEQQQQQQQGWEEGLLKQQEQTVLPEQQQQQQQGWEEGLLKQQEQTVLPEQQQQQQQEWEEGLLKQQEQTVLPEQQQQQQHHEQHVAQGNEQQEQQDQQHHEHLLSLLKQQCHDLQQQLVLREQQLGRQAEQLGMLEATQVALESSKQELESVIEQLTVQNEKLALRASKVSEEELQEVQREASERLAAAERKVFALMKERDAMKRSAAAAAAAATESADVRRLEAELKKKEEWVNQLMAEGEKLSRRQLDLEGSVKRLRSAAKAAETEKEKLSALLAAERAEAETLRKGKLKAERDLVAALEAGRQEIEAVRQSGEAELLKARAEQAAADATAAEAVTEGLAGSLAASEARCAALADSVTELQEALDRQRAAADLREELLRQDLADLQRRAQAAELRHQELSSKLSEATAPLLRQITALQDASTAHAQAWAAAERSLTARVREAEAAAAAAVEVQKDAEEQLTAMHVRLAAAEQATSSAKAAAAEASARASRAEERLLHTESQVEDAQVAAREAQAVASQLHDDLKQREHALKRKLSNETAARAAAEEELSRVRQELSQLQGMIGPAFTGMNLGSAFLGGGSFGGLSQAAGVLSNSSGRSAAAAGPPAMAAPGFRWVLVQEDEEPATAAASSRAHEQPDGSDDVGSLPGTPRSMRSGTAMSSRRQLPTGGSIGSSLAGFDTGELLRHQSQAGPLSDAASLGARTSPSVQQLHQAQLRQVQQRLGAGTIAEADLHRLRSALRQKKGECVALEGRLKELEETRDQLASELVKATHEAEKAHDAVAELPRVQAAYEELQARYAAAVELVGERDEHMEELQNDLEDMKQLYRQQIEALLAQPQQ